MHTGQEFKITISYTVFPRINAPGVNFKIRDFRGAFIRGGRLFEVGHLFQNFKNSGNRMWTYKKKKTFMPCDQCYLHCDMLTNYSHTYKNQLKLKYRKGFLRLVWPGIRNCLIK